MRSDYIIVVMPKPVDRTIGCPNCFHRFEVRGHGPFRLARSRAHSEVRARGMTAAELADSTYYSTKRITQALNGEKSFPPDLWAELAARVTDDWANDVRHFAFLTRLSREHRSPEPPTNQQLLILWSAGLTPPQIAWHTMMSRSQVRDELTGKPPMSELLSRSILGLAGSDVLNRVAAAAALPEPTNQIRTDS